MALFSIRTNSRWRRWIISNGHISATAHNLLIQRASCGHLCDSTAFLYHSTTTVWRMTPRRYVAHCCLWLIVSSDALCSWKTDFWQTFSLSVSRAEVASSSRRILGFLTNARAIAMRCFWPPLNCVPLPPTFVAYPWDRQAIQLFIFLF